MANVPLRPPGVNFFGVFLTPFPDGNNELMYWTGWDFANGWKPQIDAAKALGANFVVYFGAPGMVAQGLITMATYLARRRQIAEYIASLGMYAMTYASGSGSLTNPAFTNAQYCTVVAQDALLHSQFPGQVGFVTVDEPWAVSVDFGGTLANSTIVSYVAAQYAACKAVVPADFGICSAPNPSTQSGSAAFAYSGASQVRCDSVAAYCDFFAFHPFYTVTLAESAAVRAAYPGKELIMPSSVLTLETDSNAEIANRAASIMGLVGANGFRGMGHFIAMKYDANTYQLFNHTGTAPPVLTERPLKTAAFRANNTAINLRNRRVMRGKPRLTNFLQNGYS